MAFTTNSSFTVRLVLIIVAVVVLVILVSQYQRKKSVVSEETPVKRVRFEGFEDAKQRLVPQPSGKQPTQQLVEPSNQQDNVRPSEFSDNEDYKAVDFGTEPKATSDCFPKDKLTVTDLLPKDAANSVWSQTMPAGQGDVGNVNFLNAGYNMGINTVSSSKRLANHDLRSMPPNPKFQNLSPWLNSTVEPDTNRKYFEIGEC